MKIAVLGSGIVGETLANGFLKYGHEVMRGSRDPQKLSDWKSKSGAHALTGTFSEAAKFGTLIVLAVKGDAAESVIHLAGPENLKGKTIIDTSNPIGNVPPTNGVLNFFTNINFSLMEGLQKQVPEAHFVKAFSCVGSAFMVNPQFEGGKPSMFICGNDAASKKTVAEILIQFGWDVEDMGMAESARAIEPLCMLWCIPGLAHNQWSHAFKLLKK
jgi:predicted dinucleotide-binding enzyme